MNPVDLMLEVIRENFPPDIWTGQPLAEYRKLGNTNRGEVGEEFIRRYLTSAGIPVGNGNRASPTDVSVHGVRIEVKTASLGKGGTFQFNHVRLDKDYAHLIGLGVCPDRIVFNVWRKGDIAEGGAGKLVRMAEGQSITHKLTKPLASMLPIEELPPWAAQLARREP